jgi:arginyl-tRNA--protein-N-Asp/Glu arginylyltransferase
VKELSRYNSSVSSSTSLQVLSHYPAIPPPVDIALFVSPEHECSYFADRPAITRSIWAPFQIPPRVYHAFMDAGFRRSGRLIYQPACAGCRECRSLRVPVERFAPTKSQRRCERANADLLITEHSPEPTEEKFALYQRYLANWHGRAEQASFDEFVSFLYDSPVQTIEFQYRDTAGQLVAVGICDVCEASLSSVYFYFDPRQAKRGLGTFGALKEIAFAREWGIPYYYLGYWVRGCGAMDYKANFRPHEVLGADGVWREPGE